MSIENPGLTREILSEGWMRAIHPIRKNSLPAGEEDERFGAWHVVLAQDPSQAWCGKKPGLGGRVQHRSEEPPIEQKRCPSCDSAWLRGSPFPRQVPAIFSARKRVQ